MHDVAVLDDVVLAFDAHLAGGTDGGFGLVVDEVVVLDDLGTDEAALEIGMYHACALRGFPTAAESPCLDLHLACRDEGLQGKQMVDGLEICHGCFDGTYPMDPPEGDIRGEYEK